MRHYPGTIERLHRPSPELFRREFLEKERPVILTGVASAWKAAAWTPASLQARFGGTPLRYEEWEGDEATNDPLDFVRRQRYRDTTLAGYVDLLQRAEGPSRRIYSAAVPFLRTMPGLAEELGSLEPYMGFSPLLPARAREKLQYEPLMWLGPAGTLSTLHFDRMDNFFVQLHGRKKWVVLPRGQGECVHWPCEALGLSFLHWSPVDVEYPDLERHPRFAQATPIEFVVEPGEVLFMPVGWWHFVRSLDTSISLNFWWIRSLERVVAMRRYLFHYARATVRHKLGLDAPRPVAT